MPIIPDHPLTGKRVRYTKQEKPKGKRKTVDVTYEGTVDDVSTIGTQVVATVEIKKLLNGGATISEVVNVELLTVVEEPAK